MYIALRRRPRDANLIVAFNEIFRAAGFVLEDNAFS